MKGLIVLILLFSAIAAVWAFSDCNNRIPYADRMGILETQSKYCICPAQTTKAQGINESRCVSVYNSSFAPCASYDHCGLPEQCVRQANGSFACQYVRAGCYEYFGNDSTIRERCT